MNRETLELIHDYLDGELSIDGHRALVEWLEEAPANADEFVAECRVHSELLDLYRSPAQGGGMPLPVDQLSVASFDPSSVATDGQSGDWRSEGQSEIINSSPVLGFLGSAYHGVTGYIGDHESGAGRPRRHGVPRPAVRGLGEHRNILAVAVGQPPAAARQSGCGRSGGALPPN